MEGRRACSLLGPISSAVRMLRVLLAYNRFYYFQHEFYGTSLAAVLCTAVVVPVIKSYVMQATMEGQARGQPIGTVIFSCNGRGINLYEEPNYDSRTLAEFLPVPSSGFFCAGTSCDHKLRLTSCRLSMLTIMDNFNMDDINLNGAQCTTVSFRT
jgi:hypothetical protein